MSASISPPRIITLIFLTGLSVLTLNMFLPSLSNIAIEFDADYGLVSLAISGYLAMTAVMQIFIGPLSDRFGRRPILLVTLAVFSIASIGCFLASNITVFLVFRMMQAAIISGAALSPAIVKDMFPTKKAASLLGYISMAMAIAPMVGPMIGGFIDEIFGWRSNFALYAIVGLSILILCFFDVGETHNKRSADFGSQLRLYPSLLRSRRFWGYSLCNAFSTGAFYAFLAGAPLVATVLFEISTSELGIYIGTITIGFFLGSLTSGRLAKNYELATMMIAGRLVACIGLLGGIALFALGFSHEFILFGATVFVGYGNGVTMPSTNVGAMSVKPELSGSAASLTGALTVAGGAILTFATGVVITEQNGIHTLFGMMFFCSFAGLIIAFAVRLWERQEIKVA
ncbi:MAG: multidrug effflux MFS transporter [Pseudomonadota bacterium]